MVIVSMDFCIDRELPVPPCTQRQEIITGGCA